MVTMMLLHTQFSEEYSTQPLIELSPSIQMTMILRKTWSDQLTRMKIGPPAFKVRKDQSKRKIKKLRQSRRLRKLIRQRRRRPNLQKKRRRRSQLMPRRRRSQLIPRRRKSQRKVSRILLRLRIK